MNFEEIKVKNDIIRVINELGYEKPTEIQEKIIPLIISGYDVLGKSSTGTGKTLAFGAGFLSVLKPDGHVKSIIITPTRELAIQVEKEIKLLAKYLNVKTLCVYGSSSIENQIKEIKRKPDIIVGTPGRILDLVKRRVLNLEHIDFLVLDEADEMLNMGFIDDLKLIFSKTNEKKQVLFFSATIPKQIKELANHFLNSDYKEVNIVSTVENSLNIKQEYYLTNDKTRCESMCRLMDYYNPKRCIIFSKTKKGADELLQRLSSKKYNVDIMHGDITQAARINTLERFKEGTFNYLIATDVAARGIHVNDVDLIINYNLPQDNETYTHRIGRTGRAGNSGVAVTFVSSKEEFIIKQLQKNVNAEIEKKDLPTYDDIVSKRYENLILELKNTETSKNSKCFSEYVNSLDKDELTRLTLVLLEKEMFNKIGSDFRIDTTVSNKSKSKSKRINDKDGVRVFLTIGKLDKIDKKSLLNHLEKKSGLPTGSMYSTEVMTKFTFLTVSKKHYEKFIKSCNNSKLNGKTIKIEKSKN